MNIIDSFRGEYRWLSNFADGTVRMLDGLTYNSRENAFQAFKCKEIEDRKAFCYITPSEAKKLGRTIKLREDWDLLKLDVMYMVCYEYFVQHPEMKEKLLATGDAVLIEGNDWGDIYWGICNGIGENHLGEVLMSIRRAFQS